MLAPTLHRERDGIAGQLPSAEWRAWVLPLAWIAIAPYVLYRWVDLPVQLRFGYLCDLGYGLA